jgi:hypothetical protein
MKSGSPPVFLCPDVDVLHAGFFVGILAFI